MAQVNWEMATRCHYFGYCAGVGACFRRWTGAPGGASGELMGRLARNLISDGQRFNGRRGLPSGEAPDSAPRGHGSAEGARIMGTAGRDYYPPGDLRVSDAERDRALSELSEAWQAGRITAGEFDQRSAQVLGARTGKELTVPLADLPPAGRAPAGRGYAPER